MTSAPSMTAADLERTERYLAQDPRNPLLLANAVDTALALGLVENARGHVDSALRAEPGDVFMENRLGKILLAQGRLDEAEAVFLRVLQRHVDANVAYNLALVYLRTGQHRRGQDVLARFIDATAQAVPWSVVALYLRLLHHLGETSLAMQTALAKLANGASDPECLAVASLVALDADRMSEATQWSERALAGAARPVEALVTAGSVALARQDVQGARKFFNEALALQPSEGRSWAGLGTASLFLGDAVTAKAQFEKALVAMPDQGQVLQSLGWCLLMMGQTRAAEDAFRRAAAADPASSEPLGGLAAVCATEGRRAEAEAHMASARRIDPEDAGAQMASAMLKGEVRGQDTLLSRLIRRG